MIGGDLNLIKFLITTSKTLLSDNEGISSPWRNNASFYRTSAGAEIDLIIEHRNGRLWAIEIKRGLSVKLTRGFYQAYADLQPERAFAVHAGDDRYPIAAGIEAIGIRELVKELGSV